MRNKRSFQEGRHRKNRRVFELVTESGYQRRIPWSVSSVKAYEVYLDGTIVTSHARHASKQHEQAANAIAEAAQSLETAARALDDAKQDN